MFRNAQLIIIDKPSVNRIAATAIGLKAIRLNLIAEVLAPHIKAKNRTAKMMRSGTLAGWEVVNRLLPGCNATDSLQLEGETGIQQQDLSTPPIGELGQ